jgi:uncharacterized protein YceK
MRITIFIIAGLILGGCGTPVTVEDPRTGKSVVCSEGAFDWSPWSQREACVGDYLVQGWRITRAP